MSKEITEKFNGTAIGLGTCFFVVFWQASDSLALGIALGVAMGAALSTTGKSKCDSDSED